MSTPAISSTEGMVTRDAVPPLPSSDLAQHKPVDALGLVVDALQQRALLEPVLLLSAGYVGAPFFLRQLLLLLAPVLTLLGLSLKQPEGQHVVPQ